jgi:hypothetical protein
MRPWLGRSLYYYIRSATKHAAINSRMKIHGDPLMILCYRILLAIEQD